jgi:hypothetical protein
LLKGRRLNTARCTSSLLLENQRAIHGSTQILQSSRRDSFSLEFKSKDATLESTGIITASCVTNRPVTGRSALQENLQGFFKLIQQ